MTPVLFRCLTVAFLFFFLSSAHARSPLEDFRRFDQDPSLRSQLEVIVHAAVRKAFGEKASLPEGLSPSFRTSLYPIFVTAKKGEEVRGCMGSLHPRQASLSEEIVYNLRLAFTRDLRHRPILPDEVDGMEIFLTAVGDPIPVKGWEEIVPVRDGVLFRSGEKEAVVLPGEAKTLRYLKAFARAKAGAKKEEAYQLFKLPTATVSVKLRPDVFSKER